LRRPTRAEAATSTDAALAPNDPSYAFAAALFEHEAGRNEEAWARLDALLSKPTFERRAAALRVKIAWAKGDMARARDALLTLDVFFGLSSEEARYSAIAETVVGRPTDAERKFRALSPEGILDADATRRLFDAYVREGLFGDAARVVERRAAGVSIEGLEYPYLAALVADGRSDDAAKALASFQESGALRLAEASAEEAATVFEIAAGSEVPQLAVAREAAERLLSLDPSSTAAYRALERTATWGGDTAEVRASGAVLDALERLDKRRGRLPDDAPIDVVVHPGFLLLDGVSVPLERVSWSVMLWRRRARTGVRSAIVSTGTPECAAVDLRSALDALIAAGFTRVLLR
jgi:tetratricopeptide (TPR) repeat protein